MINEYIKKEKRKNIIVKSVQISIGLLFLIIWELLSRYNIINSFIFSSPSNVIKTIIDLYKNNNLFNNIFVTLYEIFIVLTISEIFSSRRLLISSSSKPTI